MLTKLIGRTIEAVKIYKPMKGRKIYGYNVGDTKEKLIDTSTTNFVIYHKKRKGIAYKTKRVYRLYNTIVHGNE